MKLIDEIKVINGVSKITITIDNMGKVVLKHSKDVKKKSLEAFVNNKSEWIIKKREEKLDAISKHLDFINYEKVEIFGVKYDLKKGKRNRVINNETIVYTNTKSLINSITKLSFDKFKKKLLHFTKMIKVSPSNIMFDNSKTRWGVCTSKKIVKINFRAVMLPEHLLDYILIHELCHLVQFNHSALFWKEVGKYCKDYKQCKADIKEYSFLLELYR